MKKDVSEEREVVDLTDVEDTGEDPLTEIIDLTNFVELRKKKREAEKELKILSKRSRPVLNNTREECIAFIKSKGQSQSTAGVGLNSTPRREEERDQQRKQLVDLRQRLQQEGGGKTEGKSDPWWIRFPDFVPAVLLAPEEGKTTGYNPRNGEEVHIDYVNQFSRTGQTPLTQKVPSNRAKQTRSSDEGIGRWLTKSNGKKVYITGNGKEYCGTKAYAQHMKHVEAQKKS